MKHLFSTLLLLFAFISISFAQPDNTKKVIQLTNGNEYTGTIISDDGREMLFESTTVGKIYIKKTDVKSISNYNEEEFVILDNEKVKSNAFSTRYSFTTNALPIKKKDNYYMINLWGPEFHVAVADNFNVGVMTSWIGSPFAVAAKYSIETKNPKLNFSVGEIAGSGGYFNLNTYLSLSFANVTIGDRDRNITLGGGYFVFDNHKSMVTPGTYSNNAPYQYSDRKATQGLVGSLGANFRISEKASFIFDSMFGVLNVDNTELRYDYNPISGITTDIAILVPQKKSFFIFMPGLRLNQGEGKAFQVCVAGAKINDRTFPMPYVTWFRKL
jgi:hypothetical protein